MVSLQSTPARRMGRNGAQRPLQPGLVLYRGPGDCPSLGSRSYEVCRIAELEETSSVPPPRVPDCIHDRSGLLHREIQDQGGPGGSNHDSKI